MNQRLMVIWIVNGHSTVVWRWSGDPMVPRSNSLLVKTFLLLSLLIWKGGFDILPNNTWDLLKKAYGTSKQLRFQFRGQLNKPFSEPTYLYTNLSLILNGDVLNSLIIFEFITQISNASDSLPSCNTGLLVLFSNCTRKERKRHLLFLMVLQIVTAKRQLWLIKWHYDISG